MMTSPQVENNNAKETVNCLLCSGTAELVVREHPGYQEPMTFNIYHCPNCNTSFSMPRVDTTNLYESIYKNGNKVPAYKRYWRYSSEAKTSKSPLLYLSKQEEMYWAVRDSLLKIDHNRGMKILEVGCGLGYLTYALRKEGYDVLGLDISKNAIDRANNTFGPHYVCANLFGYAPEHQGLYDLVILTEVIEHLDEPLQFLEVIMLVLKQGGRMIITTPNKSVFPPGEPWATELPPVHLWWFTEDSMKYMANKIKAGISFIDFTDFYKYKPSVVEVNKFNNTQPILNRYGEVILLQGENSKFRDLLSKIPFFRLLYVKMKSVFSNVYVCQKRGPVIGVIFQKK